MKIGTYYPVEEPEHPEETSEPININPDLTLEVLDYQIAVHDNSFAKSLRSQYSEYGSLSESQLAYVLGELDILGERSNNTPKGRECMRAQMEREGGSKKPTEFIGKPKDVKNLSKYPVKITYPDLPPQATIEECSPTESFPYMNFPYKYFNPMQTQFLSEIPKDNNVVICAATSAGKTTIAEMITSYILSEGRKIDPVATAAYIGPLKALCKEKEDDWRDQTHPFSQCNVEILTGDYSLTDARKADLSRADIVCMSCEMLGSRIRRNETEKNLWINNIRALIIDEAHLLTVEDRGPNLEAAIMKFTKVNKKARLIALSATMPNVEELGEWLTHLNGKPTSILKSTYRPVTLNMHYDIYPDKKNYRGNVNEMINNTLTTVTQYYPNDKFIVFVHAKKTGREILRRLEAQKVLAEFHSADLDKETRHRIEKDFKDRSPGSLRVLIATCGLAWGCFEGNTKIILSDGTYKCIKDMKQRQSVLSRNIQGSLEYEIINGITTKDIKPQKAFKILITNGEEIISSDNHPFCVARKGKIEYIPVNKLVVGDWVACVANIKIKKSNLKPLRKDIARARILGYVYGDGCVTYVGKHADGFSKYVIDLACDYKEPENLINIFKEYDVLCNFKKVKQKSHIPHIRRFNDGVLHLITKNRIISELCQKYIKSPKRNMRIPDFIMKNDILLKEFLQWLFLADGCIQKHSKNHQSFEYSSINRSLVDDVRYSLLRFGIYGKTTVAKTKGKLGKLLKKDGTKQIICCRHDSHRVRVYADDFILFLKKIGFPKLSRKYIEGLQYIKETLSQQKESNRLYFSGDRIPISTGILTYIKEVGINRNIIDKKYINIWTLLNTNQSPSRKVLKKVALKFGMSPTLSQWLNPDIRWEKIKKISNTYGGTFYDLNIQKNESYTANTTIVHNCNFPARRVIIMGVKRGQSYVLPLDIVQMCGRSGRIGLDKSGDAHILLNSSSHREELAHCSNVGNITSKINNEAILGFHLVSEIVERAVKNVSEAVTWYKDTLAFKQNINGNEKASAEFVRKTVQKLIDCGAITETPQGLVTTTIGKVSSWFYYSPFDVANWTSNFKRILECKSPTDAEISWAFANRLTAQTDFKIDLDAVGNELSTKLDIMGLFSPNGVKKHAYAVYCLLQGREPLVPEVNSIIYGYRTDAERMCSAIILLNKLGKYFDKLPGKNQLFEIPLRLKYGIRRDAVELVLLPGIGGVKARVLADTRGIKTCQDLMDVFHKGQEFWPYNHKRMMEIMPVCAQVIQMGKDKYLKKRFDR